jgi:hypothetical protein
LKYSCQFDVVTNGSVANKESCLLFSNKSSVSQLKLLFVYVFINQIMEILKIFSCCKSKKLPVKITDEKRSRKVGVIVSSLLDLKKKSNDLLHVITNSDDWDSLFIGLEDGTEVSDDDYLFSLQNNTLLIIYEAKPRQPAKIHSAGKFLLKT